MFDRAAGKLANVALQGSLSNLMGRKISKPRNPKTRRQISARAALASIASAFSALNIGQVSAWNEAAKGATALNRVGLPKKLSGVTLFQRVNGNRGKVGETTILTTPPTLVSLPLFNVSSVTLVDDSGDASVTVIFSENVPNGYAILASTSKSMRASQNGAPPSSDGFVNANGSTSNFSFIVEDVVQKGIVVGRYSNVKIEVVNRTTGQSVVVFSDKLEVIGA